MDHGPISSSKKSCILIPKERHQPKEDHQLVGSIGEGSHVELVEKTVKRSFGARSSGLARQTMPTSERGSTVHNKSLEYLTRDVVVVYESGPSEPSRDRPSDAANIRLKRSDGEY